MSSINSRLIYDKELANNVLGCIANDLNIVRDRECLLQARDFCDEFHKNMFLVLQNISLEKDVNEVNGYAVDSYIRNYRELHAVFEGKGGIEWLDLIKKRSDNVSYEYASKMLQKLSLLRAFNDCGMDITELYNPDETDLAKYTAKYKKLEKSDITTIKNYFRDKLIEIDLQYENNSDAYSFKAGEGIRDLIKSCKASPKWGKSFQSGLFNAVFRGMQGSKLMIRSASSGSGKTRQSVGDMCNLSVKERYNPRTKKWVKNDDVQASCFISTELTDSELQLAMLSTVAGVEEERIKDGLFNKQEEERLNYASELIENAEIYCEYVSDFSITEIEDIIEKNIIRHGVGFVFFDYIQIVPKLARELNTLFGYNLREDQMLSQFSSSLKQMANKYDVFILTSTQLNRSYKTDNQPDATFLRGGMSVLDKADYGVITMRCNKKDIAEIQHILDEDFGAMEPTHAHYVIKNRGGTWTAVIIWVAMDLDTINVQDCFVTTQNFERIDKIQKVIL